MYTQVAWEQTFEAVLQAFKLLMEPMHRLELPSQAVGACLIANAAGSILLQQKGSPFWLRKPSPLPNRS